MPISILVQDSYHTHTIAESLRQFFGDKAICYEHDCPPGVKIDVFVLSGMNVLRGGPVAIVGLKSALGSEKSKVLVTSADDGILEEIRSEPSFGVDFTLAKTKLVRHLTLADKGFGADDKTRTLNEILAAFS